MQAFAIIFPIIATILTGWSFRFFKIFPGDLSAYLIKFVYYTSIPALLLLSISEHSFRHLFYTKYIVVYGGGSLAVFVVIFSLYLIVLRKNLGTSTITALSACLSNAGFVAFPILVSLFGKLGALPAAASMLIVVIMIFPLATFLLELSRVQHTKTLSSVGLAFLRVVANPMVMSCLIGIILSLLEWHFPSPIKRYLRIFSEALTACALFAVGFDIDLTKISKNWQEILIISLVKLIVLPMLMFALCKAVSLPTFYAIAAIVVASVPPAKAVYVLAGQYRVEQEKVGAIITLSTLISIVSITIWLSILFHVYPREMTRAIF